MIEGKYYQGKERNIFQKLWDRIKAVFGKRDIIDTIYNNIHSGVYGNRAVKTSSNVFSTITYQEIAENRHRLSNTIDDKTADTMRELGITDYEFNSMTAAQKWAMKHCIV